MRWRIARNLSYFVGYCWPVSGSVRHHAASVKEVLRFGQALGCLQTAAATDTPQAAVQLRSDYASTSSSSAPANTILSIGSMSPAAGITSWSDVRLDNGKVRPLITPDLLQPASVTDLLQRLLRWPGMGQLLQWIAEAKFMDHIREGDFGQLLMDVQAPHVHFLLLEVSDILGIHPLPILYVTKSTTPSVNLLRVPDAMAALTARSGSSSGSQAAYTWQRQAMLVISNAAMQLLSPGELQVAMAAALAPLAAPGEDRKLTPAAPG